MLLRSFYLYILSLYTIIILLGLGYKLKIVRGHLTDIDREHHAVVISNDMALEYDVLVIATNMEGKMMIMMMMNDDRDDDSDVNDCGGDDGCNSDNNEADGCNSDRRLMVLTHSSTIYLTFSHSTYSILSINI